VADKKLTFNIDAKDDASKVFEKIGRTAKSEMGKVEDGLDDTRTAGKKAADALGAVFDALDADMVQTAATADRLAQAMGPELAAKVDVSKAVGEFRRMGLTLEQIEADADELAAALRKADDVSLRHFSGEADNARTSVDRVRASSDQTRSVMANLTGNAAQDLGAVAGIAGTAGVGIGQLAEYAADGNIQLSNLAKLVGPMALLGAGVSLVTAEFKRLAQAKAFDAKQVRDFSEAIADGTGVLGALKKQLEETDELIFKLRGGFDGVDVGGDIAPFLAAINVNLAEFDQLVHLSFDGWKQWIDGLRGSGASQEEINNLIVARNRLLELEAIGTETAAMKTELLATESSALITQLATMNGLVPDTRLAVEGLGDEMLETKDAGELLAEAVKRVEDTYRQMSDEISGDKALFDLEDQFGEVMKAGIEAFAANEAGAEDAADKTREHRGAVIDLRGQVLSYIQDLGNIPPNVTSDILAKVERGELDAAWAAVQRLDGSVATVILSADASRFNAVVRDAQNRAIVPIRGVNSASHQGTPAFQSGGIALVGEHGPELVGLPDGASVTSQSETKRIMQGAGRGGGGQTVVNNYWPASVSPAQVERAQRLYLQRNGTS
jgi:hypothetical protein